MSPSGSSQCPLWTPQNSKLYYPTAIISDLETNNIFVADVGSNTIVKFDFETSSLWALAGRPESGYSGDGGPADRSQVRGIEGMAVDSQRQLLYFSDLQNQRVRRVNLTSGIITTVVGNGKRCADFNLCPEMVHFIF